ncbi:hypothetical protein AC781_03230 [Akkermansia glycaniphila]|nr:hypothetical protein AC781_03230 [Akkermansia glycaniphila]
MPPGTDSACRTPGSLRHHQRRPQSRHRRTHRHRQRTRHPPLRSQKQIRCRCCRHPHPRPANAHHAAQPGRHRHHSLHESPLQRSTGQVRRQGTGSLPQTGKHTLLPAAVPILLLQRPQKGANVRHVPPLLLQQAA